MLKLFILLIPAGLAVAQDTAKELADNAGESSSLFSGTIADSLWTIVWFVVLLLVLKRFAWTHVLAGLKAREDKIANEIDTAEKTRKDAQEVLKQYKDKMEHAEGQARETAKLHLSQAEDKARQLMEEAQQESKAIRLKTDKEIKQAQNQARMELLDEAGDIVLGLGNELLARTITEKDNNKLIDEAIAKYRTQMQNE